MAADSPKFDPSSHLLDSLKRVKPLWSLVLGGLLFGFAYSLHLSALYPLAITVLFTGVVLWLFKPQARLVRKEAFRSIRSMYVGREDESDALSAAIKKHPLIWVSGESGSGKSSLLKLGVMPQLKNSLDFLPLYIDDWGKDWEAGPVNAVSRALRTSLESIGAKMLMPNPPTAEAMGSALREVQICAHRIPVLILDQFDDYLVDNIEHFNVAGAGLIVTASELALQNTFWQQIGELLVKEKIRCVVVVRQEQGWGQSTVSFVENREFVVSRLRNVYLDQVLRELGEGAISDPEYGWTELREQLAQDLGVGASGGVLPIQMRLVIQQLSSLPSLTVAAYKKSGSALGLASAHLKEIVEAVVEATRLRQEVINEVLAHLVNPDDPSKTRDVDEQELLFVAGVSSDAMLLGRVLEDLKNREVVRDRADEAGGKRWRLDHDYLALVVRELVSEHNPSIIALRDASIHFKKLSYGQRLKKAVPLKVLVGALWAAIRGRVKLTRYKDVVMVSLVAKGLPFLIWVLFAATIPFSDQIDNLNKTVASYVRALRNQGPTTQKEVDTWYKLSREPIGLRRRVEEAMVRDPKAAWGLDHDNHRSRMAAVAFAGISADARSKLVMSSPNCGLIPIPSGCVFLASQLGQSSLEVGLHAFTTGEWDGINPNAFRDLSSFVIGPHLADACIAHLVKTEGFPITVCRELAVQPSATAIEQLRSAFLLDSSFRKSHDIPEAFTEDNFEFDFRNWIESGSPKSLVDSPHPAVAPLYPNQPSSGDTAGLAREMFLQASLAQQKHLMEAAYRASLLAHNQPSNLVQQIGKEMLELSRAEEDCYYFSGFVTQSDIPTALEALRFPGCAEQTAEIEGAIVRLTGFSPETARNRWAFADLWVQPNARRYKIRSEESNQSYFLKLYDKLPIAVQRTVDRLASN